MRTVRRGLRTSVQTTSDIDTHAAAHGHEASRRSSRGGRRGCGEFSPSASPCLLPGLSCANTVRGGSSRRPRAPWNPRFSGKRTSRCASFPAVLTTCQFTLGNHSRMDGSEKSHSRIPPPHPTTDNAVRSSTSPETCHADTSAQIGEVFVAWSGGGFYPTLAIGYRGAL
jgi:hypothetical protein